MISGPGHYIGKDTEVGRKKLEKLRLAWREYLQKSWSRGKSVRGRLEGAWHTEKGG